MSEWTEEKKLWIWRSGVILDEGMVSDLMSGVLWPEPCRRWVSELKRRSCESEDLEWFWMKEWSLISCQVFSKLFRHYRRQLRAVTLGKGHCNNWVPIFVANMNKRKHLFHNEISPYFQLFYFNDRMEMFEWKINNADVFSQPSLRCQY